MPELSERDVISWYLFVLCRITGGGSLALLPGLSLTGSESVRDESLGRFPNNQGTQQWALGLKSYGKPSLCVLSWVQMSKISIQQKKERFGRKGNIFAWIAYFVIIYQCSGTSVKRLRRWQTPNWFFPYPYVVGSPTPKISAIDCIIKFNKEICRGRSGELGSCLHSTCLENKNHSFHIVKMFLWTSVMLQKTRDVSTIARCLSRACSHRKTMKKCRSGKQKTLCLTSSNI